MKILRYLILSLALVSFFSCNGNKEDEPAVQSKITLSTARSITVEAAGSDFAVEFETAEAWTATPSASWLSADVRSGEAGKARLTLGVAENNSYDARDAYLAIASGTAKDTVFVRQGEAHALIVGKSLFEVEAAGGSIEIEVSANVDYKVAIDKDAASWLSVEEGTKALEKSIVTVAVAANEDAVGREGKLTVSSGGLSETVTVSQAAGDPVLNISKTSFELGAAGGSVDFTVESNLEFELVIDEDAKDWVSVAASTKAIESSTVALEIAENTTLESRSTEVKVVAGDSGTGAVKISQKWREPVFEVVGEDQSIAPEGGTFTLGVDSEIEISVNKPAWINYVVGADGSYEFTVDANNTDAARSGNVVLYNTDYVKTKSFKVSQKSSKSIYILAIGNSFSWDAMEYLQPILYEMGYRDIFLGNLYIGGCSLQTHAGHITTGAGAYEYRTCTTGSWSSTASYSSLTALKSRDWDFVSVQQVSGMSGLAETYEPYLSTIMDKVKELSPNSRKMWHMTWAYQSNSTHSDFPRYGSNQQTMYNGIVSATKEKVVSRGDFDFVIPSGTAVQNLRSSFIGDNITRDGYHMSYDNGRLLTALMWARQITGKSVADVSYTPSGYTFSDKQKAAIKESVENAFQKPFEPTRSEYKDESRVTLEPTAELKAIFTGAGYSLDDYTALPIELTHNAFYNSTGNSTMQSSANSTASNLVQFAATQIFSKGQIRNGSVIVLKSGFQYRPEAWTALTAKNASANRPANVTTQIVVVNDAWWGSFNYRAFNLAKSGNPNLTDEEQKELEGCFAIFVPNAVAGPESSTDEILKSNGYDPANYTKLGFTYTKGGYYYSTQTKYLDKVVTNESNSSSFVATNIVEKSAIPVGSLIVVKTGFHYRPEGWQSRGAVNTATRPDAVTTKIVKVDAAWWGNYNYRGFNLSKLNNPSLINAEMDEVIDSFAVYVPK